MKHTLKLLSLLLCVAMILSVLAIGFTGCGSGDKGKEPEKEEEEEADGSKKPSESQESERKKMSTTELAAYGKERTVKITISYTAIEERNGKYYEVTYEGYGSGFFIDSHGTIGTCYHVIDKAESISVKTNNGAVYNVESIIDFNPLYDVAIIKIDLENTPYFEIGTTVVDGEIVHAVGSPGGEEAIRTSGTVSSPSKKVGMINCIYSEATISGGNSGGPLFNEYGEVIGINAMSDPKIDKIGIAINISHLMDLTRDKNYDISRFNNWYTTTTQRSYKLGYFPDGGNTCTDFTVSKFNTYQEKIGVTCLGSTDDFSAIFEGLVDETEYLEEYLYYVYKYKSSEFDQYVDYLYELGLKLIKSETFSDYVTYYYFNDFTLQGIDIHIINNTYVVIQPYTYSYEWT